MITSIDVGESNKHPFMLKKQNGNRREFLQLNKHENKLALLNAEKLKATIIKIMNKVKDGLLPLLFHSIPEILAEQLGKKKLKGTPTRKEEATLSICRLIMAIYRASLVVQLVKNLQCRRLRFDS